MRATAGDRDVGSVMPMTAILIAFLMLGAWSLVSASDEWSARREAHAAAAAAARAGAQGDPSEFRLGLVLDAESAASRAQNILAASGYSGTVIVDGVAVTVTVDVPVNYAFPAAGFPASVSGSATAVVQRGVDGQEGG
jgi:Putative Flp pilus-assembly TadE/G-like